MPREYVAKGDSNALFSLLKPVAGKLEHLRLMGSETATSPSWQLDEVTPVKLNRDMFQPFSVLNASPFEWTFQFFQFNWDEKPPSLLLIDHHQFHYVVFPIFFKKLSIQIHWIHVPPFLVILHCFRVPLPGFSNGEAFLDLMVDIRTWPLGQRLDDFEDPKSCPTKNGISRTNNWETTWKPFRTTDLANKSWGILLTNWMVWHG